VTRKKSSTSHTEQNVDVIIVGSGMVGLLLANALAGTQLSIAIVESSDHEPQWEQQHYDLRVSAITRASQRILENLGIWHDIQTRRISPFREMHVWDATGDGVIHFDSADIGLDCLGHIIENSVIQLALQQQAKLNNTVHWYQPALPEKLEFNKEHVSLKLGNGTTLNAKLIVGADGGNSWVRQQAGISIAATDYKQSAIVATVKTQKSHLETAWQRFMPTGPLAFLPLTDGYCSIVWSTTPENATTLIDCDGESFKQELANAFGHKLGDILETSPRSAFPLRSQHANHYVKDRLALIGDAAHTIHPLAGQGVNLGFADAASLAQVLMDAMRDNKDIGSIKILRRYERWRKGDNLSMLSAMTGFKMLFGNENALLKTVRNLGLNVTDGMSPIKNIIIRHAMGMAGDLPKLARPQISPT
jgi:2-octaprenylphenol hydroxylase